MVIAKESVHKGERLVVGAVIDNLIDERRWKVVFWTCVIEIVKVYENADSALFFVDGYRVRNPRRISDGVNESSCVQFVDFGFDSHDLGWV